MNAREIAEENEIIRCLVGSTLHGTGMDGHEDTDLMGVAIEPPTHVLGLKKFEHWVWRTQPDGVRSGPGDIDLTIYSLRKYIRLAAHGNPSILLLLYVPPEHCSLLLPAGKRLQALAPAIVSRQAGYRYLGYMNSQRARLLGERGGGHGKRGGAKRPELTDKFGYDSKYAMHMARLTIQGIELLRHGCLELPIPEPDRSWLRGVRYGEISLAETLQRTREDEATLKKLIDGESPLPAEPDYELIDEFLIEEYRRHWENHGLS